MKNIIKISLIYLIITVILPSCDDFLSNEQHGVQTYKTFYQTDEQAQQAVAAVYAYYSNSGTYYNIYFLKNLLSDDFWCGGGGRGDNAQNEQLNEYTFNAEHPYLVAAFQNFYGAIYRANVVLGYVPDESAVQKQVRAEAKVFRALAYIDLITMWGTPPLVDHELEPSEYKKGNGDPVKLWALVENDLKEAIASNALHEKANANDNSSYRITKQFAQALLGKAYVFQEKWTEAIPVLDEVINSGKYELYEDNYADILQYTTENNCESMFEFNYLADPNNAPMSLYFAMTGWRTDKMTLSPASEIYSGTWGFCNPQKDLYDAFVAEEGVNGYRLTQTMKTYDQILAMGDKITNGQELYGCEGYLMWKSRKVKGEAQGGFMGSHNNIRIMRYSEVLLLAAEANVRGGDTGKAATCLNKIRQRAQLAPKASVTMDDIILEKRLELCGEGTRFQDMLRWKIGEKMSAQGTNTPSLQSNGTVNWKSYNNADMAGFKPERHYLLPFPQSEITLNNNIIQNDKW
jgi:hypothetical protein